MANAYSITDLLEGKYYRSRSFARKGLDGIIQWAEKRDDVWYGRNCEAYLVTIRPEYGLGYKYRTIAVKVSDN